MAASVAARFSPSVTPEGTPSTARGRLMCQLRLWTLAMKYLIICSVTSKSAITPSLRGRMATISAGVRPSIFRASVPTERTTLLGFDIATTEGSLRTMPWPRTCTSVLAVPRSIPMSEDQSPRTESITLISGSRGGRRRRVNCGDSFSSGVEVSREAGPALLPELANQPAQERDRQANDGVDAARDHPGELPRLTLDGVGTGLVEGLAGGHVGLDHGGRQRLHPNPAGGGAAAPAAVRSDHAHRRDHAVVSTAEAPQHPAGIGGALRLPQRLPIEDDDGVAAHHPIPGPPGVDVKGLTPGRAERLLPRRQLADRVFIECRRLDLEIAAC